jgi:hypothetical protein
MDRTETGVTPVEVIERRILLIRDRKVMLDADLAELYSVTTKRLNEQVKRNQDRFPEDFMFQLTEAESQSLRSQFATSKPARGGRRYLPYVFTEHGAVMLANVLNSPVAVRASIQVVRAFVRLRELVATHKDLLQKLEALERKYEQHDADIKAIFQVLRKLLEPAPASAPPKHRIGFMVEKPDKGHRL